MSECGTELVSLLSPTISAPRAPHGNARNEATVRVVRMRAAQLLRHREGKTGFNNSAAGPSLRRPVLTVY